MDEPTEQIMPRLRNKTILVMVNNEFSNDPRVSRAVHFLGQSGYRVDVLSGAIDQSEPEVEDGAYGRIYRFRTLKPGQIGRLQGLVRMAAPSRGRRTQRSMVMSPARALVKHILYGLRLAFFAYLSLRIFISYRNLSADLYYANDFDMIMAAAAMARWHHKPLIYETHELAPEQLTSYPGWYRKLVMLLEGRLARRAAGVITVGDRISEILQQRYQLNQRPTVVASCPFFTEVEFKPRLGPPYRLLYHGAFNADRGLEQLILAMHQISEAHLFLRGYGYWEGPLRHLVEDERLSSRVTFVPPVPMSQLVAEASAFDIGIDAKLGISLNDRLCRPNKVFEYMMAGLALAVSDLPELRTIVDEHEVGIVFDPADPADIATRINELIAEPMRLARMRQNALIAARNEFNFDREGSKVARMIGPLLGTTTG